MLFFLGALHALMALSCSSTPQPRNGEIVVPQDFFGMVHAGETESNEEYALIDEMGISWISYTFYWHRIEKERGRLDFSWYDNFVDAAKSKGKKIVAVLGYEADWLYPEGKSKKYIGKEDIPLFLNFVEETVRHFEGRVDAWEIWNEPNFMFWAGRDNEFFDLTRQAAQRIRGTAPDALILGGAFWRVPKGFIKGMHKAGAMENLDGLAFHPYAASPARVMKLHDNFLKILSGLNYQGSVWITEIGYPSSGWFPIRVSLEELPSHVVKTITGAAARGTRALLWYELFDSYNEGEVPPGTRNSEKFFGLAYPNLGRKNGAWAYELCARYLPGSRYRSDLPMMENIKSSIASFCFMNGASGNNTLILWNDRDSVQKAKLRLAAPALLHDISSGRSRALQEDALIDIGKEPLFITWQGTETPKIFMEKQ